MNEKSRLIIMFTSDLHGHLLPINYSDNSLSDKGLLKISSAIKSHREEQTILIDLGDTIQGSPLMYFHQLNRDRFDNPMGLVMNHLRYDYFIPGNHDFNYGQDYLFDFINDLNAKPLCQNITLNKDLIFKNGYDIKVFQGEFKVLIIGVTTKYIPNWENPTNITNMEFLDAFEETKEIVDAYRNEVDLIICAYHGGLEKDLETGEQFVKDTGENQGYKMFTEIPGIDILLTGHQHRTIAYIQGKRAVLQPAGAGSYLGLVEVMYENNKILKIEPKLISPGDFKKDEQVYQLIQDIENQNQLFLDQIIGEVVEGDLEIIDPFAARRDKHCIVTFINEIQFQATNAMLSSTSLANVVSGFKKKITIRNVLSTYVYANTLTVVRIDGRSLRQYLEKCAEYFILEEGVIKPNPRFSYPKLEHYNYDMVDGIDYTFDLQKPFGSRLVQLDYQGISVKDMDSFTLALNNYRASGGGDFEMLKNLPIVREIPFDVAELMIDYIRKQHFLHIKPKKNIVLLK